MAKPLPNGGFIAELGCRKGSIDTVFWDRIAGQALNEELAVNRLLVDEEKGKRWFVSCINVCPRDWSIHRMHFTEITEKAPIEPTRIVISTVSRFEELEIGITEPKL